MLTHQQLRTQALADEAVKAEFDKLSDEFSLLDDFLMDRMSQGLTQAPCSASIKLSETLRHAVHQEIIQQRKFVA